MTVDRRTFVKGALGVSGAALLGGLGVTDVGLEAAASSLVRPSRYAFVDTYRSADLTLPVPAQSGIDHVVVVMMENRSFDHFLGWLPHSDGRQAGLTYPDSKGVGHKTYHQKQFDGCGFTDPDHSYEGGRYQFNHGQMNGFLSDTDNDSFAISYYEAKDRPFMSRLAREYTTCDRYFSSILGPTFPNRFFQHSGQTDRLDDAVTKATIPTIWDQLNHGEGPTGHYYYSDIPFTALWGGKYRSISFPFSQFLSDAAAGTLPNIAFVDPKFSAEGNGTSADDHPLADIRAGDAFLSQIFHSVVSGPSWNKTVLVINYDEWGGFFDHVVPRRITAGVAAGTSPAAGVDTDLNAMGKVLSGFRVPCIVASPFSRNGGKRAPVNHNFYDHTSVLKLIEWRWGLQPLTQRDASHALRDPGNLASLLNFRHPVSDVPKLPILAAFTPVPCTASTSSKAMTKAGGIGQGNNPAGGSRLMAFSPTATTTSTASATTGANPTATTSATAMSRHGAWEELARSARREGWVSPPLENSNFNAT